MKISHRGKSESLHFPNSEMKKVLLFILVVKVSFERWQTVSSIKKWNQGSFKSFFSFISRNENMFFEPRTEKGKFLMNYLIDVYAFSNIIQSSCWLRFSLNTYKVSCLLNFLYP